MIAPFEADSQLAYLSKINYIDLVITDDSDLLIYGSKKTFFKMNNKYEGRYIELEDIFNCPTLEMSNWSHNKFIQMCVLTGCDFMRLPSGFHINSSNKLFNEHDDVNQLLFKLLKSDPELKNILKDFRMAYIAIKYARVYCPTINNITTLNPLPCFLRRYFGVDHKNSFSPLFSNKLMLHNAFDFQCFFKIIQSQSNFEFTGRMLTPEQTLQIVNCELDPYTMSPFKGIYMQKMASPDESPYWKFHNSVKENIKTNSWNNLTQMNSKVNFPKNLNFFGTEKHIKIKRFFNSNKIRKKCKKIIYLSDELKSCQKFLSKTSFVRSKSWPFLDKKTSIKKQLFIYKNSFFETESSKKSRSISEKY